MKTQKISLPGMLLVALASSAGLTMQRHPAAMSAKESEPVAIRLKPMAVRSSGFNVGPTAAQTENSSSTKTEGLYSCASTTLSPAFNARFIFDTESGTVTIENFGGFNANDENRFVPETIVAPFEDGIITIACGNVGPGQENATRLGVLDAYGMDVYLQTGKIEWDENFMSCVPEPIPELKLYVSDDFSKIETRLDEGMSVTGVIDYMDFFGIWACSGACKGGMDFTRITPGEGWSVSDSSIDFGMTFAGETSTRTVTIKSTGDTDVEFSAKTDSPLFVVTPSEGVLQAASKQSFQVTYNPVAAGKDVATLTISGGGKSEKIELRASADVPATDFSAIVTEGDPSAITWDNSSAYPWRLIDGEAVNDLPLKNGEAILKATLSGNRPKRVSCDINMRRSLQDELVMRIEGHEMLRYRAAIGHTVSYIVPGGTRSVEWVLSSNIYPEGSVRIGNLCIEEVATWEGLSPDTSVTPLTAEGFMNINGNAVTSGTSSVMMLSLSPNEDSNLSFDYDAGVSEISILANDEEIGRIPSGETGTYHHEMAGGKPVFITIKATTPADNQNGGASIGNIRLSAGKYTDTPRRYNALLNSYLDTNGSYSPTDGVAYTYPLDIAITTGGKAIFRHLLPDNDLYPDAQTITGTVVGNKIHIPAYKNTNIGTIVGYDNESFKDCPAFYNNRFWLVAGAVDKDMRQTETLDELTFTISDDGKAITPDSDFGVYGTWSMENRDIVSFFRADSKFILASDIPEITTSTEFIDFGHTIANGYGYTRSISILSAGKECEYSAIIESDGDFFSVSPESGMLAEGESVELTVTLSSEKTGDFSGSLIVYSDGNDIEIPIAATVSDVPDYSEIVTEGKDLITFDPKTKYPWDMADGMAVSTNEGIHNSMSVLTALFSVPEEKIGILSFEGGTCAEPFYDGFAVIVDGNTIYSDAARNEDISVSLPFYPGDYRVEFNHVRDMVDEMYTPYDQSRLTALSLRIENPGAVHVREKIPFSLDAPVGEVASDVVRVMNTSDSPVEIISVSGDGSFGAVMPQSPMLSHKNQTVEIPVTFLSSDAGCFKGVITVETTTGIIEIPVRATADYVRYIGAAETSGYGIPYGAESLAYGDIGLSCTMCYPAESMKGLKDSQIESVTFFPSDIPDYTFSCPDILAEAGETDLSTVSNYVEGLTAVMTGEMADAVNWELTIPFDTPYTYEGGNFIFQLTNNALETYAGNTPVKMSFLQSSSIGGSSVVSFRGYAENTVKAVPFIKVKYTPGSLGVENTTRPLSEIKEIRYHNMDGTRINAPQKGLNIVTTVYNDGTTSSSVMMKRR